MESGENGLFSMRKGAIVFMYEQQKLEQGKNHHRQHIC